VALHRCTETDCPDHGKPSPRHCDCHQTDEQVLRERNAELFTALEDFDNWFAGFDPKDRASRMEGRQVVIRARAVLTKAREESLR